MTGLFNVAFLDQFQLSRSATAWIGSLHAGLFCCTGNISVAFFKSLLSQKNINPCVPIDEETFIFCCCGPMLCLLGDDMILMTETNIC